MASFNSLGTFQTDLLPKRTIWGISEFVRNICSESFEKLCSNVQIGNCFYTTKSPLQNRVPAHITYSKS